MNAYAATSFGASIMGEIFGLYRIELFTSVYKLDAEYFYSCQLVYAVWNAVNDPLFGWIIDHSGSGPNKRLPVIKYGGVLWAITFLLPWWPWSSGQGMLAVQFCVCLCAYDTFLTYVLLVHCALFADITTSNMERNRLNLGRTVAGIAGSSVAALSYFMWDKENLNMFRSFNVLVAMIAGCAFWYSGSNIKLDRMAKQEKRKKGSEYSIGFYTFCKQLGSHWNFWIYVAMNFLQNGSTAFHASYWLFFVDKIVEPMFPSLLRKIFIFASLYLSHAVIPVLTPLANKFGKYVVIRYCTILKLGIGLLMMCCQVHQWMIWSPLFLLNQLLLSTSGFYDVIIADVIDEDIVRNNRPGTMSTSVHGIQALFVKPSQSIAPVLGVYFITAHAMNTLTKDLQESGKLLNVQQQTYELFAKAIFGVAILQYFVWQNFNLHGAALKKVKTQLNEMESAVSKV